MVKKIEAFEASDGRVFPGENAAARHEFGLLLTKMVGSLVNEAMINTLWARRGEIVAFLAAQKPEPDVVQIPNKILGATGATAPVGPSGAVGRP